jgi:hypothetical protein
MRINQAGVAIMLYTFIQDAFSSNLNWDTDFPDWEGS